MAHYKGDKDKRTARRYDEKNRI